MGENSGGISAPTDIADLNKDTDMSENNSQIQNNIENTPKIIKYDIEYTYLDRGPFEVYMQSSKGKNVGNYNFLSLAKLIYDLNLTDMKKIHRKGKNRISVEFKNIAAANSFLQNKNLNEKGFELFIPTNNVTCKGIVKFIDLSFTLEELNKYSNTNKTNCKILNIRRLNRKTSDNNEIKYVPTGTICYTFSGTSLPREVLICGISFLVIPYIMPVVQCYNCYLYGHVKSQCRGKTKCHLCGEIHGTDKKCNVKCYHCDSETHKSTDRNCPEYIRQKKIKEVMSLENLSFFDANEKIPKIINKRNREFIQKPGDFPTLPNNQTQEFTPVERRREVRNNSTPLTYQATYNSILSKKKRKTSYAEGYDMHSHNQCLNLPNGREEGGEGVYFIPDTPTISRDEREDKIYRDMITIYKQLNTTDKERSIEYMTKLINNSEVVSVFGGSPQPSSFLLSNLLYNG